MKLEKLKPGMTVYDVGRQKMGNTTLTTVAIWPVHIVAVDLEARRVTARWNCNPERVYREKQVAKWRAEKPVVIRSGLHTRLATKAEIAAMKAQEPPAKATA